MSKNKFENNAQALIQIQKEKEAILEREEQSVQELITSTMSVLPVRLGSIIEYLDDVVLMAGPKNPEDFNIKRDQGVMFVRFNYSRLTQKGKINQQEAHINNRLYVSIPFDAELYVKYKEKSTRPAMVIPIDDLEEKGFIEDWEKYL